MKASASGPTRRMFLPHWWENSAGRNRKTMMTTRVAIDHGSRTSKVASPRRTSNANGVWQLGILAQRRRTFSMPDGIVHQHARATAKPAQGHGFKVSCPCGSSVHRHAASSDRGIARKREKAGASHAGKDCEHSRIRWRDSADGGDQQRLFQRDQSPVRRNRRRAPELAGTVVVIAAIRSWRALSFPA